jgi:hypothetical protein
MPKPEHRCPLCGALLNVEDCDDTTHAAATARADERKRVAEFIRREAATWSSGAIRDALKEVAGKVEKLPAL